MVQAIKFELSSNMGIIKKPDSNETYYTYNYPHKIMLLGILGAIIGLNGYNYTALQKYLGKNVENELPEFYTKLCNLKISIVPSFTETYFRKKIQTFNNSVGYASDEQGNNLVVKEQWLENPKWQIYVLKNEMPEWEKIKEYLEDRKCEYIPYIGKNDHFAEIKNIETIELQENVNENNVNSIISNKAIKSISGEIDDILGFENSYDKKYEYREILPTELSAKIGYCNFEQFIFTNKEMELDNRNIFKDKDKVLYFF